MTVPYRYQLEDVESIDRFNGRCLLAHVMGVGKSFISLLWAVRTKSFPAIVVCPASVKWTWEHECKHHFNLRSEVISGKGQWGNWLKAPVTIVNYDILSSWLEYLRGLEPKLIIVDECHYLQSRISLRTKMTRRLCKNVPYVLALSGTPLINRPAELWPTLNLLRSDLFPSFTAYAFAHCSPKRRPWGWEYKGATKIPQLHEKLIRNCMIRRRKTEVLPELPAKQRIVVPLELPDPSEYESAEKDFRKWLIENCPERLHRALRAEALVKIGYLKRLTGISKLPLVIDWVNDFLRNSDEKLLLFAIHKKVIRELHRKYEGISVTIDGSTPNQERRLAIRKFQTNPKTRILIGNIRAAGVGLNLEVANNVAFAELGWTPGEHVQAEDRCWRIGSRKNVLAYWFFARNTVEERLLRLLQRKQKVLKDTLDGKNGVYFDLIEKLVLEERKGAVRMGEGGWDRIGAAGRERSGRTGLDGWGVDRTGKAGLNGKGRERTGRGRMG